MSFCCCERCATQPRRSAASSAKTQPRRFESDSVRRAALLWHFTVLGEAATQVPAETRDAHREIAWRGATRMRNRIVHGYWDVDIETLVATAANDLPAMITALERLVRDLDE